MSVPHGSQSANIYLSTLYYILLHHIIVYYYTLPWYIATCTVYTTTQYKLLYAQVVQGKRPPAQVAAGNHHKCR